VGLAGKDTDRLDSGVRKGGLREDTPETEKAADADRLDTKTVEVVVEGLLTPVTASNVFVLGRNACSVLEKHVCMGQVGAQAGKALNGMCHG